MNRGSYDDLPVSIISRVVYGYDVCRIHFLHMRMVVPYYKQARRRKKHYFPSTDGISKREKRGEKKKNSSLPFYTPIRSYLFFQLECALIQYACNCDDTRAREKEKEAKQRGEGRGEECSQLVKECERSCKWNAVTQLSMVSMMVVMMVRRR